MMINSIVSEAPKSGFEMFCERKSNCSNLFQTRQWRILTDERKETFKSLAVRRTLNLCWNYLHFLALLCEVKTKLFMDV